MLRRLGQRGARFPGCGSRQPTGTRRRPQICGAAGGPAGSSKFNIAGRRPFCAGLRRGRPAAASCGPARERPSRGRASVPRCAPEGRASAPTRWIIGAWKTSVERRRVALTSALEQTAPHQADVHAWVGCESVASAECDADDWLSLPCRDSEWRAAILRASSGASSFLLRLRQVFLPIDPTRTPKIPPRVYFRIPVRVLATDASESVSFLGQAGSQYSGAFPRQASCHQKDSVNLFLGRFATIIVTPPYLEVLDEADTIEVIAAVEIDSVPAVNQCAFIAHQLRHFSNRP